MFEASVNRQFKARLSALNGVVQMGPISVLRRIFNGHSIDGYVLSNNFEDQLVIMKKKEFESLCKYIKVDIERTSNIPRAKLIKERGLRGVDLNPGSAFNQDFVLPYRDVTSTSYANYLNSAYLQQIQPYTHMILRGMNFSHYEVIYKAMHSRMANAINNAYEKHGLNINKALSKRSYNAEEYEVALLSVAYLGIDELKPKYFILVCADDGSGARAMKNKLDKYRGKDIEDKHSLNKENRFNPCWYIDSLNRNSNKFISVEEEFPASKNSGPKILIKVPLSKEELCLIGVRAEINTEDLGPIKSYFLRISIEDFNFKQLKHPLYILRYSEKDKVSELEKKLFQYIEECKKDILNAVSKGYDFSDDDWYKCFLRRYPNKFEIYRGSNPCGLPKNTYNFIYKKGTTKYPLNISSNPNLFNRGPGCRILATEWPLEGHGLFYKDLQGLTMKEIDAELFSVFDSIVNYIDKEEAKLAEQNNLSEEAKKEREVLYTTWYLNYLSKNGFTYSEKKGLAGHITEVSIDNFTILMSRKNPYHNKYVLKISSNIDGMRDNYIDCGFSTPIEELERKLEKILSKIVEKIGYSISSKGLQVSMNSLEKEAMESRLEVLTNEIERLRDEYSSVMEERRKVVSMIKKIMNHMPLEDSGNCWYIDDLISRKEEIAIQFVNNDNYRHPSAVFSYTDEYTRSLDKFVSFMCIDSISSDYDDDVCVRIYPFREHGEVEREEIFMLQDSLFDRSETISEAIYECLHNARPDGMSEKEALECYDWYKVINAEDIIENLKDDDLYDIDKRLKEILDEKKPIEAEINKLNRKLGKKGQQIIFNDSVVSDFSDIETNRVRRNENKSSDDDDPFAYSDPLEDIKDIASLFQY